MSGRDGLGDARADTEREAARTQSVQLRRLIRRVTALFCLNALWLSVAVPVCAQTGMRFPQPEFESGYTIPETQAAPPRAAVWEVIDVTVLLGMLALASYAVLRFRRRGAIFALSLFALAYFGFWRHGCICPIGAVQNVIVPIFEPTYRLPWTVLVLFAAPLVVALFWGRTFCAAVCPLGAIQDLFALRPLHLPAWLSQALSVVAYLYLGLVVLFVASGSGFLICRYDPFVAFFRRDGEAAMILFGLALLIFGVFVGRPYCRFLCPYGVVLGWMSTVTRRHATIAPDDCIQCRLCEKSCPFGAINAPQAELGVKERRRASSRLRRVLFLLPVLLAMGAVMGMLVQEPLARLNPTVRLAEELVIGPTHTDAELIDRRAAFDASRQSRADLFAKANRIRSTFAMGTPLLGLFLAVTVAVKLLRVSVRRERRDYEPDRALCFSCGRCFAYCPREQVRRNSRREG